MYKPSQEVLKKYADVFIKFALRNWEWMKKWDVICLQASESARPLLIEVQKSVLEVWWHYILTYIPEWNQKVFFENASDEQINFLPESYYIELSNTCDHFLKILSTDDKYELSWIDSKKIMARQKALKPFFDARTKKENEWKQFRTLGLYWTETMAKEAGLTLEEYWNEIIKACFLDEVDPITKWKNVFKENLDIRQKLDKLKIDNVHIVWEDVDLIVKIWEDRKWLGWSWRNIPSFEIFTSPDWRGTNWWIKFNQPLYNSWNIIEWIRLEFKDGIIINCSAQKWEDLIREMIKVKNADKIWEFSLTDRRFSKITKFMGETLYDENVWWEFGNTHIAIWCCFKDAFVGDIKTQKEEDWDRMWFNDSVIHTDIMSTSNRKVTATLVNWDKVVIYENGEFLV